MSPLLRGLVQAPSRPSRRPSAPVARAAGQRAAADAADRLSPSD
jgi:hypothetical protein